MMGYTDTEGMLYDLAEGAATRIGVNLTDEDLQLIIPFNMNVSPGSTASKEIVAALKNLYKGQPFEDRYNPMTDSALLVSSIQALRLHLKNLNQPLYLYRMSLNAGLNQLKLILNRLNDTGAAHTDELGYLFYSSIIPTIKKGSLEDVSVRRFVELWTNFATFGNPTPSGSSLVQWEPVAREDNIRVLDIGEKLVMKDIPEQSRLTVWWDLLKKWPYVKFSS